MDELLAAKLGDSSNRCLLTQGSGGQGGVRDPKESTDVRCVCSLLL